jgi:hypothetical protein
MADDALLVRSAGLIAGRFAVDTSQVLLDAGGGIDAYLALDRMASDGRRVALGVSRTASPRDRALRALPDPIDNLMTPRRWPAGKGSGISSSARRRQARRCLPG